MKNFMSARRCLIGVLILAGLFSATAQSIIGQQTRRSPERSPGRQAGLDPGFGEANSGSETGATVKLEA